MVGSESEDAGSSPSSVSPLSNSGKGQAKKGERKGKPGPMQEAHQLKKQHFNKVLSDLAANKNFHLGFPAASLPHVG